jgi:hypothetical protein
MHLALIINSVVCVVGVIVGLLFAGASIVSIANMTVPWSGMLVVAALLVPVAFVVSGVGAWVAYGQGFNQLAVSLIALPWLYGLIFVALMLVSFKRNR